MRQSPLLEFDSSAFPIKRGEDDETNPGLFGKALAEWLAQQLTQRGWESGQVIAEDFAWCVPIESGTHRLYVACSSADERADRWMVFAFAEGGLIARFFGRDKRQESLAALFSAVRACLESNPDVNNLQQSLG